MAPETLQEILDFDARGFMPMPGESGEDFAARTREILTRHGELMRELEENGKTTVFDDVELSFDERIGEEIVSEAADLTWGLYRFKSTHVPGFFLSRAVGLLWGGCMIADPDEKISVFLIRNAFKTRSRWLFYRRNELLAHELCHSMHQDIMEQELEEFFAYQTSPSVLRRYLGNCFIRDLDALFFVIPTLVLLAAVMLQSFFFSRMIVWPFWILAVVYPAFLLIRNARARSRVFRAKRCLETAGFSDTAMAILFRCRCVELDEIAALPPERESVTAYVRRMAEKELRWKIILHRFIDNTEQL